jgi:hypothetical protein
LKFTDEEHTLSRPPIASISSINIIQGESARASENNFLILFDPTPTNTSSNSEPDTEIKGTPASPEIKNYIIEDL